MDGGALQASWEGLFWLLDTQGGNGVPELSGAVGVVTARRADRQQPGSV
jgi:hypothetical protein